MELNKNHREKLLIELDSVNKEIELQTAIINKVSNEKDSVIRDKNQTVSDWHDIALFLAQNKKTLIERSLVDNEIDY